MCPNHPSLPRLTTTETLSMSSRLNSSALAFISLSLTLHIHLIIILSVLSSLCISSAFIADASLPYQYGLIYSGSCQLADQNRASGAIKWPVWRQLGASGAVGIFTNTCRILARICSHRLHDVYSYELQ